MNERLDFGINNQIEKRFDLTDEQIQKLKLVLLMMIKRLEHKAKEYFDLENLLRGIRANLANSAFLKNESIETVEKEKAKLQVYTKNFEKLPSKLKEVDQKKLNDYFGNIRNFDFKNAKRLKSIYEHVSILMLDYLEEKNHSFDVFVDYFLNESNFVNYKLKYNQSVYEIAEEFLVNNKQEKIEDKIDESNDFVTNSEAYQNKKDESFFSGELISLKPEAFQIKHEEKNIVDQSAVIEEKPAKVSKENILPPIPPDLKVEVSQKKYQKKLDELRNQLLVKQEKLSKFGALKGLFNQKGKQNLLKEIEAIQVNIEKLKQEKLSQGISSFVLERSAALERRVKQIEEENQKKFAGKLYAFYEKYFMKKLLPEKMIAKLEKQGFLGRLLANGCTVNAALSFSLFGGGIAIGGASIVGAGILSGRRLLSGAASGVGSYNLLKLGSDAWAKSHGWDKELSDLELKKMSSDTLQTYLAHYEARVLVNGKSVNNDSYYKNLLKAFENKLVGKKPEIKFDNRVFGEYLIAQEKELDQRLQKALVEKTKDKSRLKYYATAIGVFVGSGMLQKVLGNLFVKDGSAMTDQPNIEKSTLLAEQSSDVQSFPPLTENFDLFDEKALNVDAIPELKVDASGVVPTDTIQVVNESYLQNLTDFNGSHPLLEKAGGAVEIINGKAQVVFDISVGGDFELKQQALRRVMMDVFPLQEVLDKDGLSVVDIGRIESNVTTFTKLLEGKSFHGFSSDILKDVMKMDGGQLVISDYDKLAKISEQVLAESKHWVPDASSGFVKVGQSTGNKIWETMLNTKLQNIKT